MIREFSANAPEDLDEVAEHIGSMLSKYSIAFFQAEMGAGKTTLIKKVCDYFGVSSETTSPTFSIVNEYRDRTGKPIYHFDLYRLKNQREALDVGLLEYLDSGYPCLIEWPELIIDLVTDKHLEININLVETNTRKIKVVSPD